MKYIFTLFMCAALFLPMQAQNFNDYFENKTLRTDYIFTGDAQKQEVYLDELSSLPHWAGRRHHLSELPLEGNGQITMKDKATGDVIYRTSFLGKGSRNEFSNPFLMRVASSSPNHSWKRLEKEVR